MDNNLNFDSLVGRINLIQDALQAQAAHAVNLSLTARNWLVGYYIVEYEQHGEDRAKYGENLLKKLAKSLNRRGLGERRLYEYRLTYQVYPQVVNQIALGSYVSSLLILSLLMGVLFEIPLVAWALARAGLLHASTLCRYRKHALVALMILAAVITPTGDAVTLLLVTLPLYLLYELSIAIIRRKK